MNLTSLFTGGASTLYKYLAVLGLTLSGMVGSYFYGNHVGTQSQQIAQQKGEIKTQKEYITITKTQTIIDTEAVKALQIQLDTEKAKTISLQNKLSKLSDQNLQVVKKTSDGKIECALSKDWIDTYNESLKGVSP